MVVVLSSVFDVAGLRADFSADGTGAIHIAGLCLHGTTDVATNVYVAGLRRDATDVSGDRDLLARVDLKTFDVAVHSDADLLRVRRNVLAVDDYTTVTDSDTAVTGVSDAVDGDSACHGSSVPGCSEERTRSSLGRTCARGSRCTRPA